MNDFANMDGKKMWRIEHGGMSEYYAHPNGQISPTVETTSAIELMIVAGACIMLAIFVLIAIPTLL